jgi:hypothetical protein
MLGFHPYFNIQHNYEICLFFNEEEATTPLVRPGRRIIFRCNLFVETEFRQTSFI